VFILFQHDQQEANSVAETDQNHSGVESFWGSGFSRCSSHVKIPVIDSPKELPA
jgi:hypothetical protein